ncbi:MAG: CsbD family protein [Steroidobacteraceae bacterium]
MNKDQVKGRVKVAKGTVKQVTGKLVGNQKLQTKGAFQKNLGKVQANFGDLKKKVMDFRR